MLSNYFVFCRGSYTMLFVLHLVHLGADISCLMRWRSNQVAKRVANKIHHDRPKLGIHASRLHRIGFNLFHLAHSSPNRLAGRDVNETRIFRLPSQLGDEKKELD